MFKYLIVYIHAETTSDLQKPTYDSLSRVYFTSVNVIESFFIFFFAFLKYHVISMRLLIH